MIVITEEELDIGRVVSHVENPGAGAIVTFVGATRDNTAGRRVRYLEYEAYRPMADRQLERVAEEMRECWELTGVAIYHRLGRLESVRSVSSSPYRPRTARRRSKHAASASTESSRSFPFGKKSSSSAVRSGSAASRTSTR